MAPHNGSTNVNRIAEARHLARELMDDGSATGFEDALQQAYRLVPELADVAAAWDAQAEQAAPTGPLLVELTNQDMSVDEAAEWAGETLYIPSALEPHEQRAVDKALYERARGIVPQLVGRFWFVPSRSQGGTIYRTTLDSCTCDAFAHGRLCWHRALIGLERERAA